MLHDMLGEWDDLLIALAAMATIIGTWISYLSYRTHVSKRTAGDGSPRPDRPDPRSSNLVEQVHARIKRFIEWSDAMRHFALGLCIAFTIFVAVEEQDWSLAFGMLPITLLGAYFCVVVPGRRVLFWATRVRSELASLDLAQRHALIDRLLGDEALRRRRGPRRRIGGLLLEA